MPRPTAVTVDVNDDVFFWTDYENGLEFVKTVGGRVLVIPEDIEEDE